MLDLLKKIGVPGTVAAVVASLVTMVPFLFKIDERYAKEEDVVRLIEKLERRNQRLEREIAQLSGFQEAMVKFIQEGRMPRSAAAEAPAPAPVAAVPVPTPVPSPVLAPPARRAPPTARPSLEERFGGGTGSGAPAPVPVAPASTTPAPAPEQPSNWRELRDGLMRQQERLKAAD